MKTLEDIRTEIDEIDEQLMVLLDKRIELVKEVKELKRANNIAVLDEKREQDIYKNIVKNCSNSKVITTIYHKILDETKNLQRG